MSSNRSLRRLFRRLVVATANRSTRVARRLMYKRRICSILQSAHADALRLSKTFEGHLFGEDINFTMLDKDFVDAALRIEKGEFVLFGEWFEVPETLKGLGNQWYTDFLTEVQFPLAYYTDISPKLDIADIKVPWEYGRLHYLVPLSVAYRMTRDARYLDAFRTKVNCFFSSNPLGTGVQWACTMEVGIRVFNLLAAYELMHDALTDDDELHLLIAEMAVCHGEHIWANLETSARLQENNHYIADLLGLAAIVSCYPSTSKARRWGRYIRRELIRCSGKQILSDGCCFERSSRYTRLVGEMLFFAGKVLARTPYALPKEYFDKISLLGDFLNSITDDSGCSPQLGDNDSGRVMCISPNAYDDLRLVGRLAARERGIDIGAAQFLEEELLYGAAVRRGNADSLKDGFNVFPDAGVAFSRLQGWSLGFYASDGFKGEGEAGHTHNDKLSFTLDVDGVSFFTDPGSGTYTRDTRLRNVLRGTSQHSTLWFDRLEQNEFGGLFGYVKCGGASLDIEEQSCHVIVIKGSTDCWRKRVGVIHKREVIFDPIRVLIHDKLEGAVPSLPAMRSFVLAPSVSITRLTEKSLILSSGDVAVLFESNAEVQLRKGFYSARYGSIESTTILDTLFILEEPNSITIRRYRSDS